MRTRWIRVPVLCLVPAVLLLFAAGVRPAEASGGSIGAHLGYAKARHAEDGNGLVGGQLEIRLASWLGIQGAVDYRLVNKYKIDASVASGDLKIRSVPTTLSAKLYIPLVVFSPFAEAGAGWYHLIYDYSSSLKAAGLSDDTETTFGWHVGGGVELPIAPRVSIYGEGRAVFVDPDHALNREIRDEIKNFDYDSTYFAAGLNLHF
jgi:opacity protein-like surface antigen